MIDYFEFALILIIIALGAWVWKLYQEKQEAEKEAKCGTSDVPHFVF